jgi:hypothetical protein
MLWPIWNIELNSEVGRGNGQNDMGALDPVNSLQKTNIDITDDTRNRQSVWTVPSDAKNSILPKNRFYLSLSYIEVNLDMSVRNHCHITQIKILLSLIPIARHPSMKVSKWRRGRSMGQMYQWCPGRRFCSCTTFVSMLVSQMLLWFVLPQVRAMTAARSPGRRGGFMRILKASQVPDSSPLDTIILILLWSIAMKKSLDLRAPPTSKERKKIGSSLFVPFLIVRSKLLSVEGFWSVMSLVQWLRFSTRVLERGINDPGVESFVYKVMIFHCAPFGIWNWRGITACHSQTPNFVNAITPWTFVGSETRRFRALCLRYCGKSVEGARSQIQYSEIRMLYVQIGDHGDSHRKESRHADIRRWNASSDICRLS